LDIENTEPVGLSSWGKLGQGMVVPVLELPGQKRLHLNGENFRIGGLADCTEGGVSKYGTSFSHSVLSDHVAKY